jgi:hypothetical protein
MKKYTAVIVAREFVWLDKESGQPVELNNQEKLLDGFLGSPKYMTFNLYTKIATIEANTYKEMDAEYQHAVEYIQVWPVFAPSNTVDLEVIITRKGKVATGNTTTFLV